MIKKILTKIDTKPERDYIEIDGRNYGVITADELELKDLLYLQRARAKIQLGELSDSTDESVDEMSEMLDRMTRIILFDMPDEVHKRLRDMHRMDIIASFTEARRALQNPPIANENTSEESLVLQDSTEAVLASGVT